MRIAQVAPLCERVPPVSYGGTERVVSYLTEELVRQGHDVTLFATADADTQAKLVPCSRRALRLDPECRDMVAHHILLLERVRSMLDEFDIVHYHIDYLHFPLSRRTACPHVTTLHGRLDLPDLGPLYQEFTDMPLVSISNAQRVPLPWAAWRATVYHGLPSDLYTFHEGPGEYLAFIGRICPEKRLDRAINIARQVKLPLKVAAKIDKVDEEYFRREIAPLMDDPLVEYIGEIDDARKDDFLGRAIALLFPIDWPEPFGLVMIEAMACGTPVIAYAHGAAPEIVDDGLTGFVIDPAAGESVAADALLRIAHINRRACRETFEQRFQANRMAAAYVDVYSRCIEECAWRRSAAQPTM